MKETRRSLCDSESGVKKMAMGHHLGECSHAIERSHNLLSGKRVERQDFVNLEEGGSEWVWDQCGVEIGCGTKVQCSGAVRSGMGRCAVFERKELEQDPQQASPVLPSDQACLWVSTGSPSLCGAGVLCHTSPNTHALHVSSSSTLHSME